MALNGLIVTEFGRMVVVGGIGVSAIGCSSSAAPVGGGSLISPFLIRFKIPSTSAPEIICVKMLKKI